MKKKNTKAGGISIQLNSLLDLAKIVYEKIDINENKARLKIARIQLNEKILAGIILLEFKLDRISG